MKVVLTAMGNTFSSMTLNVLCKVGNVALIKSQSINFQATVMPSKLRLTTVDKINMKVTFWCPTSIHFIIIFCERL